MGGAVIKATTILNVKHIRNGEVIGTRRVVNKKVTTAFVNFLVDNLQTETSEFGDFKYHASGTDNTAESNTDTTLGAEVESRVTGTQTEGASANIYKSVGTVTYTATRSIYEHGLFSQSTGGTLMYRTVFALISVVTDDQIEFTFEITFNAEA